MTSLAVDVAPAVENIIRRCLDPDTQRRPDNALSVAAALPGGDPLAAAMAAGETPSPELVAAAGKTEGIAIRYGVICLATVFLCAASIPFLMQQKVGFFQTAATYPPDVLHQRAREVAASFGYTQRPADTAQWLDQRLDLLTFLNLHSAPRHWIDWLNAESPVQAVYRESLSPLVAQPDGDVSLSNPPLNQPGMTELVTDLEGWLRGFLGIPSTQTNSISPPPIDAVLKAAQIDRDRFHEVTPITVPAVLTDRLSAWEGIHPSIPGLAMHIEIGSWRDTVTYLNIRWPWTKASGALRVNGWIADIQKLLVPVLGVAALFFAVLLARRNWKLGRGDRRGAFIIAAVLFLLSLLIWIWRVHAVPTAATFAFMNEALADATFRGALFFLLYMALEPELRSRWPHSIITWNRAIAGKWNDAKLASDILIGLAVGALMLIVVQIHDVALASRYGYDTVGGLFLLNGTRTWISGVLSRMQEGITTGITIFFAIFGLRLLARREWIVAIAGAIVFSLMQGDLAKALNWQIEFAVYVALFTAIIFILLKLGLVVTITAVFALNVINGITLGSDWTAWYAPTGFATMALILGLSVWAFWRSLGDRDLLKS